MEISIIIPVYNKEKYLKKSIESVLNQTYKDFELIIVDDGSTDNSKKIVDNFLKTDKRVQYYYQTNQGVSAARNKGIREAKGKYISFLDADDWWEVTFLEKMQKKIDGYNICYCGTNLINSKSKSAKRIKYREGDILTDFIKNKTTPHTNSWLIKIDFIQQNEIYFLEGLSWGEDLLFFSMLLLKDTNIVYVKENLNNHRKDVNESLSQNSLDKIDADFNWMQYLINYIEDNETNEFRKVELIDLIRGYRLPGTIVHRLLINIEVEDNSIILEYYKKYKKYITNLKLYNGLRSIKLILNRNKLIKKIDKILEVK